MNFNLKENSVGMYQISKLLCIPYMVVLSGEYPGHLKSVALTFIITGVALNTVRSEVTLTQLGFLYAVLGVVTSSQSQVWLQSYQKNGITSVQLLNAIMPFQFMLSLMAALVFEQNAIGQIPIYTPQIAYTCLAAVAANMFAVALIGKSSALTFQVIGHMKTILTLGFGYVMFGQSLNWPGAFLAVLGGVMFTMK